MLGRRWDAGRPKPACHDGCRLIDRRHDLQAEDLAEVASGRRPTCTAAASRHTRHRRASRAAGRRVIRWLVLKIRRGALRLRARSRRSIRRRRRRTALRIGGWILVGLGGVLVIAGVALIVIHLTQRGKDGYYTSSTEHVAAPGYAVTAEGLHIGDLPSIATDVVGRVRVSARSSNGQALFVGIAPQTAVNAYLAGVARSEVTDVNGDTVTYKTHPGRAPAGPPGRESFWQSASTGSGQVTASWKVKGGTWAIVLMNATRRCARQRGRERRRENQPAAVARPRLPPRRSDRRCSGRRDALEQPLTPTDSHLNSPHQRFRTKPGRRPGEASAD